MQENGMLDPSIMAWIALAVAVSLAPGPDVLLVFGHATRRGPRAGLSAALGITIGGIWYMALCGLGFLSILALSPTLFVIAKVVGALYLAWLGLKLILGAVRPAPSSDTESVRLEAPFRQGSSQRC
jgi:threonine/homoserine/homoserine lactone efflux protein